MKKFLIGFLVFFFLVGVNISQAKKEVALKSTVVTVVDSAKVVDTAVFNLNDSLIVAGNKDVYENTETFTYWISTLFAKRDPNGVFGLGWGLVMTILYGVIAFILAVFVKTKKKYTWAFWIVDLLERFIPNKSSSGGVHTKTVWQMLWELYKKIREKK